MTDHREDMTNPGNHSPFCSFMTGWPNGTCDFDCADYTPSKRAEIHRASEEHRAKVTRGEITPFFSEDRWDV